MDKLAEESKPSDSLYCIMDKLAEESKPSDFQLWQVRLELLLTHLYPYEIQNVDDFREENDSNLHSIHILLQNVMDSYICRNSALELGKLSKVDGGAGMTKNNVFYLPMSIGTFFLCTLESLSAIRPKSSDIESSNPIIAALLSHVVRLWLRTSLSYAEIFLN